MAWRGVAWRGVAWRGVAWRGMMWHDVVLILPGPARHMMVLGYVIMYVCTCGTVEFAYLVLLVGARFLPLLDWESEALDLFAWVFEN